MKVGRNTFFLIIGILSIILSFILTTNIPSVKAATNDTVIISLNVSLLSEIIVTPAAIEWLDIVPTYTATLYSVDIQNTGSVNFTRLWSTVNSFAIETTNPIGKGNPALYAAGSFLVLKNETGEAGYRFVNRIEWNETEQPTYMTLNPADAVSWGYFRNFTDIYLWNFNDSATAGQCLNGSQMEFRIKSSAESLSSPNRDMTVGTIAATFEANTTEWSSWTFASGPLQDYCVYIYRDCSRIMVAQWDYNQTLPSCSARKYITTEDFMSGMIHTVNLTVLVPRGVPTGNTSTSVLTIVAE
ncbi:MAG: hypothetical protein QXF88_00330 [Candidatus Aenigmatarchaeota archaeon]